MSSSAHPSDFHRLPPQIDLPATERGVIELWDRIDAFQESIDRRPADNEYVFYDGPPFANGTPHYGHLLASTTKDVVPRYWTMRGHRIERKWGWDTHGLPVEMKVQEALGVAGPAEIADYGIARFNAACRDLVTSTADEWDYIVRRLGRWVDMDDDYRTMDTDFMESVWWVFRQLWDKGLVYQSVKVLPYSWGATTPLSNFEANLDYRDVDDPSIIVRMPVLVGNDVVPDGRRAADLDDHAVDPARQPRHRGRRGPHVRPGAQRGRRRRWRAATSGWCRNWSSTCCPTAKSWPRPRVPTWWASSTSRRSTTSTTNATEAPSAWSRPRRSRPTRAPGWCTWHPPTARSTSSPSRRPAWTS